MGAALLLPYERLVPEATILALEELLSEQFLEYPWYCCLGRKK